MNNVILMGRLTKDVELRYTQSGMASARFNIAVDKNLSKEKKQEMQSKGQQTADFINCVAWGKTAENIEKYTDKGLRILVHGSIQTGSYDKDGHRVFTTDVLVNNFEFIDFKESNNNQYAEQQHTTDDSGYSYDFDPTEDKRIPF